MIEVKIMIPILSSHLIFIIATSFILISIVLFYISFSTNLKNYLLDKYRITRNVIFVSLIFILVNNRNITSYDRNKNLYENLKKLL